MSFKDPCLQGYNACTAGPISKNPQLSPASSKGAVTGFGYLDFSPFS